MFKNNKFVQNFIPWLMFACFLGVCIGYCIAKMPEYNTFTIETEQSNNELFIHDKTGKINLNNANAVEFADLPGIGPTLAERIIEYRKQHGNFKKVEDLLNVKGIGENTLAKFIEYIEIT